MPNDLVVIPRDRVGRPTSYTPELAEEICSRIASGETLIEICEEADKPAEVTVRKWALTNYMGFRAPYTQACELRLEHYAEKIHLHSTRTRYHTLRTESRGPQGVTETIREEEMLGRDRLITENLKWTLAKLHGSYKQTAARGAADRESGDPADDDTSGTLESTGVRVTIVNGLSEEGN